MVKEEETVIESVSWTLETLETTYESYDLALIRKNAKEKIDQG
jgi:hypothetical protein